MIKIIIIFTSFHAGLKLECNLNGSIVGETMNCFCYSDIDSSSSIRWFRKDPATLLSSELDITGNLIVAVTTDDAGLVYTCSLSSDCGVQEKSITIDATGKTQGV